MRRRRWINAARRRRRKLRSIPLANVRVRTCDYIARCRDWEKLRAFGIVAPMRLDALAQVLDAIAPTRFAEPWDNVGLLAGDRAAEISRVLLTIDCTRRVLDEAIASKCELVLSYHPPLFKPKARLLAGDIVFEAIRHGVALYSPHTALDVAEGGTNDVLADIAGLEERAPLRVAETKDTQLKLVTFVPEAHVERVSEALFSAGAGRIGNYRSCSFRSEGTGTFFGEEGTNPTVGEAGQLETAPELRIETVLSLANVDAVVRALRAAHPYEEPAFDLVRLAAPPEGRGIGRIGTIRPKGRRAVVEQVRDGLGVSHVLVAGPLEGDAHRVAVCAGAGGDLLSDALAQRADVFVTGELRHHDALRAAEAGVTVIAALHSNSERVALDAYAARIMEACRGEPRGIAIARAKSDADPFKPFIR